jgi:hypothetical protein
VKHGAAPGLPREVQSNAVRVALDREVEVEVARGKEQVAHGAADEEQRYAGLIAAFDGESDGAAYAR